MDKNYIAPANALKKLKTARSLPQTVYLYGATGYGKTELVRQYLAGRRYIYLSCEELPWPLGAIPPENPDRQTRRVVVIDDLHRLKQEELRQEVLTLEQREDIWLILISRSPIPAWLMPRHIRDVFVVITENDLKMGRDEITRYLESCGITYTEEDIRYLQETAEGNAYILHHVALRMKEGIHPGPELQAEIREALSRLSYLDIALPHRGSRDVLAVMKNIPALLLDKGNHLPEFSVTSNLPSTMNGGKDFCHWSPEDAKLARTVGPLAERVLGRYGKGFIKAALGESYYEKGRSASAQHPGVPMPSGSV